jgi:hypothetical protein
MSQVVNGCHHTRVAGTERLEAARVEMQANDDHFSIQAMSTIALDGEHIGLNDKPDPAPFAWSRLAQESTDE